jgi:hypothetical protein
LNAKVEKKIRKELRRKEIQLKHQIAFGLKDMVNKLPLRARMRMAWRMILRKF